MRHATIHQSTVRFIMVLALVFLCSGCFDFDALVQGGPKADSGVEAGLDSSLEAGTEAGLDLRLDGQMPDNKLQDQKVPDQKLVDWKTWPDQKVPDQKVPDQKLVDWKTWPDQKVPDQMVVDQMLGDQKIPWPDGTVFADQSVAANCADGIMNGTETDVDCGGSCKARCADTKGCKVATDCQSSVCDTGAATPVCMAPTCTDTVKNGAETDVDCGGTCTTKCANSKGCQAHTDCTSTYCSPAMFCDNEPGHCTTKSKDGDESDVDCGGSCKAKCALGKACNNPDDCTSKSCTSNKCD